MSELVRTAFLDAASVAAGLIGRRDLGEKWADRSALEGLEIGHLAAHLARAVLTVHWYLDMPEGDPPTITAGDYFAGSTSDTDAEANVAVRERAIEAARGGWARLYLDIGNALDHLHRRLPGEPADHRIPTGGHTLLLDEYLRTRIVELVVHIGDLCRSLEIETPSMPDATRVAIGVLLDTALTRHGEARVLNALARRELDTIDALRVL